MSRTRLPGTIPKGPTGQRKINDRFAFAWEKKMLEFTRNHLWDAPMDRVGVMTDRMSAEIEPSIHEAAAVTVNIRRPQQFAQAMHQLPEARRELVFRIRRQIAEGNYESEDKLTLAMERLFADVLGDQRFGDDE